MSPGVVGKWLNYHQSSIVYDVYETVRFLNYVLPGEAAAPGDTQEQRVERVLACQERLEKRFLRHLDVSIPFHCMYSSPFRTCVMFNIITLRNNYIFYRMFYEYLLAWAIPWSSFQESLTYALQGAPRWSQTA